MKVALCLYGQPRVYREGYNSLKKLIDTHSLDVFCHFWYSEKHEPYTGPPWRKINNQPLKKPEDLLSLYKPIKWLHEEPREFKVDTSTVGFQKSRGVNASNILSQIHSRQSVRDILLDYCKESNTTYDYVIVTRYDILITKLPENIFAFANNILVPGTHLNRPLAVNDNFGVYRFEDFSKVFNFRERLDRLLTNGPGCIEEISAFKSMDDYRSIIGGTKLNMEEILVGSILDCGLFSKVVKSIELEVRFADELKSPEV